MLQIDELEGQKQMRTEMIQVEDNLAQTRKEYDMLRIEFEQAMAANDQNCEHFCLYSNTYLKRQYKRKIFGIADDI